MILAAYIVVGFLVASIYATGMLKGRRDRLHRLGLLIPLTIGLIAAPLQFLVGDTAARAVAENQPAKFAGMECIQKTGGHQTEYVGGICTSSGVKAAIPIPDLDSFLVGFSADTKVTGLNSIPPQNRPPANTLLHLSFDAMIGICTALHRPRRLGAVRLVAAARHPEDGLVPARGGDLRRGGGPLALVRLDRHRGRAPALDRPGLHADRRSGDARARHLVQLRRGAAALRGGRDDRDPRPAGDVEALARGRRRGADAPRTPIRAAGRADGRGGGSVSEADVAAGILWVGATFYALFGGADFGGGFWDLIAGDAEKGERPRALIQRSLTPVWEANHVWLIFILVVLWTAFPPAFSAVMTTLYVPLALAAVGIVLRGSGFAFRKSIEGLSARRAAGATFALSSVLTPFFMGTVVGAIAAGNVPAAGDGDAFSSWLQPLPLLTGAMFVATGAYLSAVFLVGDARRAGEDDLERYFVRRALAAALVAGIAAAVGLVELHSEARYIFDRLVDQGLPLVILSALCGIGLLVAPPARRAPPAAPARRRRRRRGDLGLGSRPVPLPAADQPQDRGRGGPERDPRRRC